jgi:uncharacterized membrane protein
MANPSDEVAILRSQLGALTARIYRLEQKMGLDTAPMPAGQPATPVPPPPPPSGTAAQASPSASGTPPAAPPGMSAPPAFTQAPRKTSGDLEGKIGKLWFNWIGIFAILAGVAYFLKYAFESNLIGEGGRVAIGLVSGIAVILWSERFRSKGSVFFSYSLKAVGIGTLYLSFWGAFQVYHLVQADVAFVAMALVTAFTITLSLTQNAEILALYAIIGGFLTPVALSTGQNHEAVLFSYVCLLDLAILVMVKFKPWRRLLVGSFIGTAIMYAGWYDRFYASEARQMTVLFALAFAAIFAVIPLVTPLTESRWFKGFSVTLTFLPLFNAAGLFLALYAMYEHETVTLTWYALALGAVYLGISSQFKRRVGSQPAVVKVINLLHIAIAIAFITIAIPLKLNAHWITIGWLIESAVLLFVAVKTQTNFLRYFAGVTLALGIFRLLVVDDFSTDTLVFNPRFATYLVAIAIMGGIVAAGERYASAREKPLVKIAGVALNLLALLALTLEVRDYFSHQVTIRYEQTHDYTTYRQLEIVRDFSYSAIWLLYGAGLMAVGFWKRLAFLRWQALVLMAFTIGKVFIYDASNLQKGYRILSFIALGVVLMGISYAYQKDWLKLSSRSPVEPDQRTSA